MNLAFLLCSSFLSLCLPLSLNHHSSLLWSSSWWRKHDPLFCHLSSFNMLTDGFCFFSFSCLPSTHLSPLMADDADAFFILCLLLFLFCACFLSSRCQEKQLGLSHFTASASSSSETESAASPGASSSSSSLSSVCVEASKKGEKKEREKRGDLSVCCVRFWNEWKGKQDEEKQERKSWNEKKREQEKCKGKERKRATKSQTFFCNRKTHDSWKIKKEKEGLNETKEESER